MKVTMKGCTINGAGTVFDLPGNSGIELNMEDTALFNVQTFMNERDPASLHQRLGLPDGTPHELLKELMLEFVRQASNSEVSKEEIIKSSRLWSFVQHAANATSVLSNLVAMGAAAPDWIAEVSQAASKL